MTIETYAALKTAVPSDVESALRAEQEILRKPKHYLVAKCVSEQGPHFYRILSGEGAELIPQQVEALEGLRVAWVGLPRECFVKLTVTNAQLGLVALKGLLDPNLELPPNTPVSVWEHDFLAPVLEWWQQDGNAEKAMKSLHIRPDNDLVNQFVYERLKALPGYHGFSKREKSLIEMACREVSLLKGPPGTGKTTELSQLTCNYLEAVPKARILIVSFTNRGTDELNLRIARTKRHAFKQARVGRGYEKRAYEEFPDLIVKSGDPINSNLVDPNEYFSLGPNPGSAFEGVYAMTCFAALERFQRLKTIDFDLVILDEASQVSLPQGLPLLSLGRSVIIAGDDVQLNPVCKTTAPEHFMFNGVSPFILKHGLSASAKFELLEQFRMPYVAGKFVSDEFYGRKLKLADCVHSDLQWQKFRQRNFAHFSTDEHLIFEQIRHESNAGKDGQCRRVASAERIVELLLSDTYGEYAPSEIAILTPFNSQVYLLWELLKKANLNGITVSSTHRQQGAQYPLTFWDPVDGNGGFMRSSIGDSIINVAASRTQSKLIMVGSDRDCQNPRLRTLRQYSDLPHQLLGY